MHDSIREDAEEEALQQPPEGVNAEQRLQQQSGDLWVCRQTGGRNEGSKPKSSDGRNTQPTLATDTGRPSQSIQ